MDRSHPGLYRRPSHQGVPYESPRPSPTSAEAGTPLHRADPSLMKPTAEPAAVKAQRRRAGIVWATPTELASRANARIASGVFDLSLRGRKAFFRVLSETPGRVRAALEMRQGRLNPERTATTGVVIGSPAPEARGL